jgi:biopolymer transport protein ExbD
MDMFNDHLTTLLFQSCDEEDLDLTNLIDLFSLLNCFFIMVVPPLAFMSSTLAVAPGDPVTGNGKPAVVIRMNELGSVILNDEPIEIDAIGTRLEELKRATSLTGVLLAIDKDARYEPSRQVRAIVSGLGLRCDEVSRLPRE